MKLLINHKIFASNDIEEIGHYRLMRDPLNDTYTVTDLTDDSVVKTNLTYTHAKSLANKLVESEMRQSSNKSKDEARNNQPSGKAKSVDNKNKKHTYIGTVDIMLHGNVYIADYQMKTTAVSEAKARNNLRFRFENDRENGKFPEESCIGDIDIVQLD